MWACGMCHRASIEVTRKLRGVVLSFYHVGLEVSKLGSKDLHPERVPGPLIGALGVELCLQVCVCWQALQPQVCDAFPHALCDVFH